MSFGSSPSHDFLPGLGSIPDGRRIENARTPQPSRNLSPIIDGSLDLPFPSVWNVVDTSGESPKIRSGQSINFWPEDSSIIACYGRNDDDTLSDEFWKFSLGEQQWIRLEVTGATPRAACGSVLVDNKIWFYGGISTLSFTTELHYLDLDKLEIVYPITTGDNPPPCALPLIAYYHPYLIIWSGVSCSTPSSLHVLNTDEMNWQQITTDYICRQGACGSIIDSTLYVFGASSPMSVLELDLETFEFTLVPTTGTEPPRGLDSLTTFAAGNVIIALETFGFMSETKIYIFDIEHASWTCYAVPIWNENKENDSESGDGEARGQTGIVLYIPDERKVVALSEGNEKFEKPVTELSIGRSIAMLNQKLDFLAMLDAI
ncbi:Kelch motif family protein [Histomonas meleagridis]|uniref:Kelch motif family protein n=1 Tax=Histomonas meleagridis TaxID=135588 RepID=UPI0035598410|nr:Kelch motif family protein [Histomonas meleagridis]KAH0796224.1 Kelch motif family protein [Histomonas meleagridis]